MSVLGGLWKHQNNPACTRSASLHNVAVGHYTEEEQRKNATLSPTIPLFLQFQGRSIPSLGRQPMGLSTSISSPSALLSLLQFHCFYNSRVNPYLVWAQSRWGFPQQCPLPCSGGGSSQWRGCSGRTLATGTGHSHRCGTSWHGRSWGAVFGKKNNDL